MQNEGWLQRYVDENGGVAGTVHVLDAGGLKLTEAVNIPPKVQEVVKHVPRGKGMAGLALERNQPVQTCNLRTDATGDVRPGARAVNAQAAVAIPVHDATGAVRAVVGIAFAHEREVEGDELAKLIAGAERL